MSASSANVTPPDLAEVLAAHRWESRPTIPCAPGCYYCATCELAFNSLSAHEAHQAQVWREACTITTVEQLDALPKMSCVQDADGIAWQKFGQAWLTVGAVGDFNSVDIRLPVRWHPEWAR